MAGWIARLFCGHEWREQFKHQHNEDEVFCSFQACRWCGKMRDVPLALDYAPPEAPRGCRTVLVYPDGRIVYQRFEPMGGGWAT